METPPLEFPATPERLRRLAHSGHLGAGALERALALAGHLPDVTAWRRFIDVALLALGSVFTLSGIIFFFAYNWADIPPFAKFGLIQAAIIGAVGLATWRGLQRLEGRVALLAAAILVGVLLAVFGQVYQTGADAYQLFLGWSVLIVGWVIVGRFIPLWLLLLVLLNLTIGLYWQQRLDSYSTASWVLLSETLFALNVAWLVGREYLAHRGVSWIGRRWAPQLVTAAALLFIIGPTLELILSGGATELPRVLAPVLFIGFVSACIFFSYRVVRDLIILTLCSLSIIVVVTAAIGKAIGFDTWSFLLLSLLVVGQAALAAHLLNRARKTWEPQEV